MHEIYIYDVIGEDFFGEGITAKSIRDQLVDLPVEDSLRVRINSPGGDVHQALAIRTLLRERDAAVQIDGLAASAASVIAMQRDLVMADGAMLMIHNPWTITIGDAEDHQRTLNALEKHADTIAGLYADKSGNAREDIRAWMAAETWYTAEEAHEAGFADSIADEDVMACAIDPRFGYRNADRWLSCAASQRRNGRNLASQEAMRRRLALTRFVK